MRSRDVGCSIVVDRSTSSGTISRRFATREAQVLFVLQCQFEALTHARGCYRA